MRVEAPAHASGQGIPPSASIELLLDATRLAILGLLVAIGLGTAGVALTIDDRGWVGAVVGGLSVLLACGLLRFGWSRGKLARSAAWVLPLGQAGG
jgi:hypothetical protein